MKNKVKALLGLILTVTLVAGCGSSSGAPAPLPGTDEEKVGETSNAEDVGAGAIQSTDVSYDFEAPEIDDEEAFELNLPGDDNGEYVDVRAIYEQYPDMGSAFVPTASDDPYHYTGYGRNFHGYRVEITSIDNEYDKGAVVIRGLNSNKMIASVPVTIFDENFICAYGEGEKDDHHTDLGYTYVKSIKNLEKILKILNETDNYDDADKCPLEHSLMYHVHPSTKNKDATTKKPEDFSPYDDYFDIEEYFRSWQTDGSILYSVITDNMSDYGFEPGRNYAASFIFNGWELEIYYADTKGLMGSEAGKIILRDAHTTEQYAVFEQPPEESRRLVVIDKDGNTTYEGTLETLIKIMPVLVSEEEENYCPLDGIGVEHSH